ncbi:uncharacterized protein LOC136069649 [Quercus suber]|uniref:uncharacterized protein LOC136069649 n=1 Tax=Quercus suber TaxID=58331 RepID=UPI0032DF3670
MQLEAWNKNVFGHVGRKINELQKHLEWLELQPASLGNIQDMRDTRLELNKWHEKEDAMWYQRSRINWFRDGDRNTRYFHAKASARLKKNQIDGMLDAQEIWQDDEGKVGEIVEEYYTALFKTSHPKEFNEMLQAIQPKVTPQMNQMLDKAFTASEVHVALKQMHPLKAPGPDAFETMHHINGRKGGKKGEMALKLDMSKAYDRVEWLCLENIMEKLGFGEKLRSLIMKCVTSVSYSVKINRKPGGKIIPSRGIRQGDPLSPYLFLLCAEGLSALIKKSVDKGDMEGVTVCRGAPHLSHLFFADDSIIFCKATIEECNTIQRILGVYEQASGQQLNRTKTALFFSKNTPDDIKEEIKNRFGAQVIRQHEKYLGLPSLVGKNKRNTFNDIKDKLSKKLAGWKEKLLSKAGKEVLIKAVAQAIPTYTISCFKKPDSLCDELTSMIRNFWWGQKGDERKISWLSWDKMCETKANGGMGFRQLKQFNLALLAKQGWRLQVMHDSLAYRLFKARYFPHTDFVNATIGNHPSFAWRSIMAAQHLVQQGIRWNVGNGESIRVWGDKWLPSSSTFKVVSPKLFMHADLRVSELISHDSVGWKMQVIDTLFLPHEAENIKSIPLSTHLPPDKLIWAATTNGLFSVRSAYRLAMENSQAENVGSSSNGRGLRSFWRRIWRIPVPHKVRHFTWRACREILPTKMNLKRRKVVDVDSCEECNDGLESSGHLFWSCQRARQV